MTAPVRLGAVSLLTTLLACELAPANVIVSRAGEAGIDGFVTEDASGGDTAARAEGCLRIGVIGRIDQPNTGTFRRWLAESSTDLVPLDAPLEDRVLAPLHVILIAESLVRTFAEDEIAALERWVDAGGGVFALSGYTADDNAEVNALLAPLGVQFGTRLLIVNPLANASWPVETWLAHPVSEGVTRVGVVSAYEVLGDGELIAQGNDVIAGAVAVMRGRAHGAGRVLAWGDEWITFDSEWSEGAGYQVPTLWQNVLTWLAPPGCRPP
jgi:hypothetical protein